MPFPPHYSRAFVNTCSPSKQLNESPPGLFTVFFFFLEKTYSRPLPEDDERRTTTTDLSVKIPPSRR